MVMTSFLLQATSGISWLPQFWQFYSISEVMTIIAVTLFMYWLTTRPHNFLKRHGLRDGVYIDVVVMKAGGMITDFHTNGVNLGEAFGNAIKGLFGWNKDIKEIVVDNLKEQLKDNLSKTQNIPPELITQFQKDAIVKIMKDEYDKIYKGDKKETTKKHWWKK